MNFLSYFFSRHNKSFPTIICEPLNFTQKICVHLQQNFFNYDCYSYSEHQQRPDHSLWHDSSRPCQTRKYTFGISCNGGFDQQ